MNTHKKSCILKRYADQRSFKISVLLNSLGKTDYPFTVRPDNSGGIDLKIKNHFTYNNNDEL